jgi:hypothetical protein
MIATFLLVGDQPWAPLMVESISRVTGYHVVQMSDLTTPEVEGVDEVIRLPMKVPLMSFRLKHLANLPYREWVTLDTDILVKKPLADVWDKDFDVAVTKRPPRRVLLDGVDIAPEMPYNTGFMLSREPQFWQDAYDWLRKQNEQRQSWWGDQLAVSEIAKRNRYNVALLPSSEFNWTPDSPQQTSEARVWHYKGAMRKEWMWKPFAYS